MTSLVDAESVLAIDIGTQNTRALLFDLVDGTYHFISAATAPTTAAAPFRDVSEGVHIALTKLEEITGRKFTDNNSALILPAREDGAGVDRLALTCSAGGDLKVVTLGLLSDVSLQSAQRLAGTTYSRIVESIGLNDRRKPDAQIDAIIQAAPDLIVIAGGTEKGATRSVAKQIELVALACRMMPAARRPKVLYCGNQAIKKKAFEILERETSVNVTANIRPGIDQEDLSPAENALAKLTATLRTQQMNGLEGLARISSAPVLPSAYAFSRVMRLSSRLTEITKPTLGVDLGAGATTLAVAQDGDSHLAVFRDLGMGASLQSALQQTRVDDVAQWVPFDIPAGEMRDALYQKSLFPAALPLTPETLAIEQGMARQVLRMAVQRFLERWPDTQLNFERIFVSGASLALAPSAAQALMMVLDGIQPVGVSVVMLDPYGLSQSLGAIASENTLLPAQILESGAYANLATILCPLSSARPGTTIMHVKITYDGGSATSAEIKQGSLVSLPISNGQVAHLEIDAHHGAVLDPSLPRLKRFKVTGGLCGVVVDARSRPLSLPTDAAKRRDTLLHWASSLEDRQPAPAPRKEG